MGKTYSHGGNSVTIADDGAIQVKPGDWLSKYSMAIHHDLTHVNEYGRLNGGANVIPVADANLIRAGETLYHIPTRQKWNGGAPGGPGGPQEKRRRIAYYGVDGTGTEDRDEYRDTFKDSFVNELRRSWRASQLGPSGYSRGPTNPGFETGALAVVAANFIRSALDGGTADGAFLAGYSRGGSAVLDAAAMLKSTGHKVDCLILFDAVDRSVTSGRWGGLQQPVVDTVAEVYHARRNPSTNSRPSFGNTGTQLQGRSWGSPYAEMSYFWATHGGMGGVPWKPGTGVSPNERIVETVPYLPDNHTLVSYHQDQQGSRQVHDWMWRRVFSAIGRALAPAATP